MSAVRRVPACTWRRAPAGLAARPPRPAVRALRATGDATPPRPLQTVLRVLVQARPGAPRVAVGAARRMTERTCRICGRVDPPGHYLSAGRCQQCAIYWRRYGVE